MSDKWTPGEWIATKSGDILAPDGLRTVTVARVGAFHDKEIVSFNRVRWAADARLIAAAPDMAKALHNLIALASPFMTDAPQQLGLSLARAALAKARGLA